MKILIIAVLVFISGCDLFTTRPAENPDSGRSSFQDATTKEQLFKNFTNSFIEKIESNYERNFADSAFSDKKFIFTPSSEAIVKYNILIEWNLKAEKNYFRNLINSIKESQTITINLELISSSVESNSANYNYDYSIQLPFISEEIPQIYRGNSFFKIELDANNHWVITQWIDNKTLDFPSWSELKGRFYL